MKMSVRSVAVLTIALAVWLPSCTTNRLARAAPEGPFKMAITVDDLPVHGPIPEGRTALDVNRQMVEAIKAEQVTGVTAFINAHWVERDPANLAALQLWRDAGIPLYNHTWSHQNLNGLTVEAYKQEIVRNEPILNRLMTGQDWRWFRYPFLAEGDDRAKRAEIRTFLADRGYRIAGVSMDFSDWQLNTAYGRCKQANDRRAQRRIRKMYLEAARDHVVHSRRLGKAIYGRDIPQVQLMHVGALSAEMMPQLIRQYRAMGARFVSLGEAQADPAYAEDNDPRLPARSQFIGARAQAMGIILPYPKDLEPELQAMCR